jgi:hypothetical protein
MRKNISHITVICLLLLLYSASNLLAATLNSENDPLANLGDLYAFVDPPCQAVAGAGCEADPIELIVALTINPNASGAEQFSDEVVYHFYFENDSGVEDRIDCSFTADQVVTCEGMGGLSAEARVGQVGVNGDLRVYAGLRDNPMYFDLDAFEQFQTIGIAAYMGQGEDSLAGTNVMAIVLGIKITAMSSGSTANHNVQKIWAASERISGDGVNAAMSGTWYNTAQAGQGWVMEVIGRPSAPDDFLGFFYGYDNEGQQLWFITGAAVIDGNRVTADLYRTSATGFGGDFDPGSFVLGEIVGTVTFEFDSCDSGKATFVSNDAESLPDFSNDITRLTSIATLDCTLFVAGQVDRVGRPFIADMMPMEMRNSYDSNSEPDSWNAAYYDALLASLQAFATADGDPAWNGFYTAPDWADIFVDDRLQIDVKKAQQVNYLSLELSQLVPQDWNDSSGRKLGEDIHEIHFNVLITAFDPFVDDSISANDVPFLSEFPFLAPPHN